ncbi:hypothetical protein [Bosea sp. WAO]|uniref:hypothetical protein n=1 Tax=Bosea sp. WAO TaxID=406341 RepID=UPI000A45E5A6|nr:hypothetical protein [Bosea sp. WAO]
MATLPEIVNYLEGDDALHLGRLLVLIDTFGGRNGEKQIEGLTKLAKLDFLLRYPDYLERALLARDVLDPSIGAHDFERHSIEARMVRFKYGPWDHRYRRFLNTLAGRGLVAVGASGRTIMIGLTERGRRAASSLREEPEYAAIAQRAILLKRHLDLSASTLMEFVYKTFPELASLRMGETIEQ